MRPFLTILCLFVVNTSQADAITVTSGAGAYGTPAKCEFGAEVVFTHSVLVELPEPQWIGQTLLIQTTGRDRCEFFTGAVIESGFSSLRIFEGTNSIFICAPTFGNCPLGARGYTDVFGTGLPLEDHATSFCHQPCYCW